MDTAVPHRTVQLSEIQGMSKVTPKHDVLSKLSTLQCCVNIALAFAA